MNVARWERIACKGDGAWIVNSRSGIQDLIPKAWSEAVRAEQVAEKVILPARKAAGADVHAEKVVADREISPQGLKPIVFGPYSARMNPCPFKTACWSSFSAACEALTSREMRLRPG